MPWDTDSAQTTALFQSLGPPTPTPLLRFDLVQLEPLALSEELVRSVRHEAMVSRDVVKNSCKGKTCVA